MSEAAAVMTFQRRIAACLQRLAVEAQQVTTYREAHDLARRLRDEVQQLAGRLNDDLLATRAHEAALARARAEAG